MLLMSPSYHLTMRENRLQALGEAVASSKPRGSLSSALISRYGTVGYLVRHVRKWIELQKVVHSILERGHHDEDVPKGGLHGCYVSMEEIALWTRKLASRLWSWPACSRPSQRRTRATSRLKAGTGSFGLSYPTR